MTTNRDNTKLADQVSSMVDALNATLTEIAKQTKYDAATKTSSPLTGNSTVRQVQQMLAEALTGSADSTPSSLGISLGRDGKVSFDKAKFLEAYNRDPAATQALFTPGATPGVGARLVSVVDRAINATDGLLTSAAGRSHQGGRRPGHADRGLPGAPRQAAGDAADAVHRHGDRAQQPPLPVLLAGQPTQQPQRMTPTSVEIPRW